MFTITRIQKKIIYRERIMRIKQFFGEKLASIQRFFVPFVWTVYIAVCAIILIVGDWSNEHATTFILIGMLGFFLSILAKLIAEYLEGIYDYSWFKWLPAVSIVSFALYPMLKNHQSTFVGMYYFGIVFAIVCLSAFFAFKRDTSRAITEFIKTGFWAAIITAILCGGISLCLYAFYTLVWQFGAEGKVFGIVNILIVILVSGNFILSGLTPPNKTIIRMGKIYKGILYVTSAIYAVLLLVLIVYFVKILVTWNLPSNQVSVFGNVAILAAVFFVFVMDQFKHDNKVIHLHQKFIGIVILVIIAMNAVSMSLRIHEYGLTESRYVMLILNGIAALFAISTLIKHGKFNNYIFVVGALATIILTCTPLNIFKVPFDNQKAMLITELKANNMYDNSAIIPNSDVSDSTKSYITNHWYTLLASPQIQKDAWNDEQNANMSDIFGFNYYSPDITDQGTIYVDYYRPDSPININGYSTFNQFSSNYADGDSINKDFLALYQQYGENGQPPESEFEVYQDNGDKIILTDITLIINANDGSLQYYYVDGYYLTK